jgi:hypothetical protein
MWLLVSVAISAVATGDEEVDLAAIRRDVERRRAEERDRLRDERDDLRQDRDELRQTLDSIREIRGWAVREFVDAREVADGQPDDPRVFDRWRRVHAMTARRLLDFPANESRAAIKSGRALNFFLDTIGDLALEHELQLKRLRDLQETRPDEFSEAHQKHLELLEALDDALSVPDSALRSVHCQQGLSGPRLPIRLSATGEAAIEPLPLDWPGFFLVNTEYQPYLDAVTDARERALAELQSERFGGAAQRDLMFAVDRLQAKFQRHLDVHRDLVLLRSDIDVRHHSGVPELRTPSNQRPYQIVEAMKFLRTLRFGLSRLLETRYLNTAPLESRRDDGSFSVIQLMSFMKQNGLRFAEATPSEEVAYGQLFEVATNYYERMLSLRIVVDELEQEITYTDQQIEETIVLERQHMQMCVAEDEAQAATAKAEASEAWGWATFKGIELLLELMRR